MKLLLDTCVSGLALHFLKSAGHNVICSAVVLSVALGCAAPPARPVGAGEARPGAPGGFEAALALQLLAVTPPPPAELDEQWRLTHFHRLGGDQHLLAALETALVERRLGPDSDGALRHFFAAAFSRRPVALDALRARAAAGDPAAIRGSLARAAREFSSPAPISPAAVDALWAEYRALGERSTLAGIIGVLGLAPSAENEALVRHAALSLARNIPIHGELDYLEEVRDGAAGRQRLLLSLVLDAVRRLRDEADGLADRGDNLLQEGQAAAAVEKLQEALRRYPAYHPAYTSLARYYEKSGNLPLALRQAERAVLFAPEDAFSQTNLGRVLYRQRRYPEALKVAEGTLKSDPTYSYGYYLLGLIRQALGEREQAVALLKRSIELEPNSDCSGDARRRLAAMNIALPADPTDLVRLLRQREYDAIEQRLAQLLESREKDVHGKSPLMDACEKLGTPSRNERAFAARLGELQAWLAAKPGSHFALLCTGFCLVEYGYFGRGGGYAPTVTELGWKLFRERLESGRSHLERAFAADPTDPVAPRQLIWAATGLGLERQEAQRQIERAKAADPAFIEAHLMMLTYLLPRWHGSHEQLLAYARAVAADAAPGSSVARVLGQAHNLIYTDLERAGADATGYFRDPEVWREVQGVYEVVLRDFPDSTQIRNWYAKAAYLAGEYGIAREQFKRIGDAWYNYCWPSFSAFQEARRKVFASE